MWYVVPALRTGPAGPNCQPEPFPMNSRISPLGPVFSHHPAKPGPMVDQIVLLTGSTDGRTTTSSENWNGVHAGSAGTSTYWLDPFSETAVSLSRARRPATPCCGFPT